ncbi:MAG: hypothetical protein LBH32_06640 [Dysgonamonadaceae bacterium]|nr:hypothetical protein [Dysgonamonadaceae bacterium]
MKKIIFCIFCLISINARTQTPVELIEAGLKRAVEINSFKDYYSLVYNLYNYKKIITDNELNTIFELQKKYLGSSENSYSPILYGINTIYNISENPILRREIIYFMEQAINDTVIRYGGSIMEGVDLHIFDWRMKNEVVKNLSFSYKDNSSYHMLNRNMILLAGALEIRKLKGRLQIISDSSCIYSEYKNAARIALCRMGDKKMLKEYFTELRSLPLEGVVDKWREIEYIKQKESVDILLKILYSEETLPSVKETLPDEKLAYYAMQAIERISKNCPFKVQNINSNERDKYLTEMRRWAKKNKIIINRSIW